MKVEVFFDILTSITFANNGIFLAIYLLTRITRCMSESSTEISNLINFNKKSTLKYYNKIYH